MSVKSPIILTRQDYCPRCYGKLNFEISSAENGIFPICKKCKWTGDWAEVLDEYEAKNMKRTKLIDEMTK